MRRHRTLGRCAVLAVLACGALSLGACLGMDRPVAPPPLAPLDPSALTLIRSYGWSTSVADPQASWAPGDNRVLARASSGCEVFVGNDGDSPSELYHSVERRPSWDPAWVNANQVVFGPRDNVQRLDDGRVVPTVDGLTLLSLGADPKPMPLTKLGFRPRVADNGMYVQSEDRILAIDIAGTVTEFGRGFFAEPQRGGPGIAWQETPVTETDWWTGRAIRSDLDVRWRPGSVDLIHAAVEPRWCADGGILATVLRADPPANGPWWKAGTDVVYLAGPGKAPRVVAHDARDASPHPTRALVAVASATGRVLLIARDGSKSVDFCAGCHPRWNFDGTRLLVQDRPSEPPAAAPGMPGSEGGADASANVITAAAGGGAPNHLTVYVFTLAAR